MTDETVDPATRERLLDAALEVANRAYAPYSGFSVGAALLTEAGNIFQGCNVENASYGLTNCAERTAIFTAVASEGAQTMKIRAIAVVTASGEPATPCGACRQVISEFNPDAQVIFRSESGIESLSVRELLPLGFTLE
jgi:cytidine deaminase